MKSKREAVKYFSKAICIHFVKEHSAFWRRLRNPYSFCQETHSCILLQKTLTRFLKLFNLKQCYQSLYPSKSTGTPFLFFSKKHSTLSVIFHEAMLHSRFSLANKVLFPESSPHKITGFSLVVPYIFASSKPKAAIPCALITWSWLPGC